MKINSLVSFFLLISVLAFAEEKKDSVETRKFSLCFSGGINTATMKYEANFLPINATRRRTNEFFELKCLYPNKYFVQVSLGASYHHFSYYTWYYSEVYNESIDVKMLLIPAHLIIATNENKKIFLHFYGGPEFGLILQQNTGYKGNALFFSAGGDINYSFDKYFAVGLGASNSFQANQFTYLPSSPNVGQPGFLSISYMAFSINVKYKFKWKLKT